MDGSNACKALESNQGTKNETIFRAVGIGAAGAATTGPIIYLVWLVWQVVEILQFHPDCTRNNLRCKTTFSAHMKVHFNLAY